jgi:hypothetical protein
LSLPRALRSMASASTLAQRKKLSRVSASRLLFTKKAHRAQIQSTARSFGQTIALTPIEISPYPAVAAHGGTMATNAVVLTEAPAGREKRLWQAVIVTAIQEWISGPLRSKRQAEEYLFQDQKDFPLVCQSAGMDADCLRAKLRRLRLRKSTS